MVEAKPALQVPSPFYSWMQRSYVMGQASAIRRLVDWDGRTISLIRLIEEIADHSEVLSRRRYVGTTGAICLWRPDTGPSTIWRRLGPTRSTVG